MFVLHAKKCRCVYDVESRQEKTRMNFMSKYWETGKKNGFGKKITTYISRSSMKKMARIL